MRSEIAKLQIRQWVDEVEGVEWRVDGRQLFHHSLSCQSAERCHDGSAFGRLQHSLEHFAQVVAVGDEHLAVEREHDVFIVGDLQPLQSLWPA